jgi:hypothetical protein
MIEGADERSSPNIRPDNIGLVAASNSIQVGLLSLRVLIVDDSETTRRILRVIIHSQYWFVSARLPLNKDVWRASHERMSATLQETT